MMSDPLRLAGVVAVRRGRCHASAMAAKGGIEALMEVVCAEWCLGRVMHGDGEVSDVTQLIPRTGKVAADQFVDWVFLASAVEARDGTPKWRRARAAIRTAFVRHLGAVVVEADALRWDVVDVLGRPMLPLPDPVAFARNLTDAELEAWRELDGEDSREWIIAREELARRQLPWRLRALAWGLWLIALALIARHRGWL